MSDESRPDPDVLLRALQKTEEKSRGGKLRIFLGMSAGVGKTYAMLSAARAAAAEGVDVAVGVVETHGRKETEALLEGMTILPRKKIIYKSTQLEEMDLDSILERRPQLVLVDELAHTNAPGSRHSKRYQDVLELLDQKIDVYTTINVQHIESRKDAVEQISGVSIRETVPDSLLERAQQLELVDITPDSLLKRLRAGKVYLGDRARAAEENFFREGQLTALREIALRLTAEKVDQDLRHIMDGEQIQGPWRATERLLVAVSHSPYSERLIRATRGIAFSLEAPWIGVNIRTGAKLNDVDRAQLSRNLALVRELGGEVVSTSDADIATALQRIARRENATQIILGRPTRRYFRDLIEGGSLIDRLVREGGQLDVHVIRQNSARESRAGFWDRVNFLSTLGDYWNVSWILLLVTTFSEVIAPYAGYKAVGFLFLIAVLGVSLFVPMGPMLYAALISSLAWDYFFIPPQMTFNISEKEDVIMCGVYLVAAVTTGLLTNKIRNQAKLLQDREEKSHLMYEVVSDIANSKDVNEFMRPILNRMSHLLNGVCTVLLRDKNGDLSTFDGSHMILDEKEKAVAHWAANSGKRAGWGTDTLSEASALYLPLIRPSGILGVFVLIPNQRKPLDVDKEDILFVVARQLAISVERAQFEVQAREGTRLKESEKLHQTLLDSISHELRTPLTSILGTATALSDGVIPPENTLGRALLDELISAGDRLNQVVENLLDMTRLSGGAMNLKKEWHDVVDVIGVTVNKLSRFLQGHKVVSSFPEEVILVNVDFRLLEHAFSNLLLNAAAYSFPKSDIQVSVTMTTKFVDIIFADNGIGVPEAELERIFEKFYRVPGTPAGGTGLGLAIVKNIVEIHGGTIHAENLKASKPGLCVTVRLPRGEPPKVQVE